MSVDSVEETRADENPPPPGGFAAIVAFLRNTWRGLTSMRTALLLLFLLAVAALPGALLPQRSLNSPKVADYIAAHGWWGRLLDRLQFYDVYTSVWFSAIYLLLFVSLVGCLVPRSFEYVKSVRARPVLTPRNLSRLPHYATFTLDLQPEDAIRNAKLKLRSWRFVERTEAGGVRTISAERGYLREVGNLVFHFAVLGLVVALAIGKLFSYEGQVIVLADGSQFCNSGTLGYDSFRPGLKVDGTNLDPFCVKVNSFQAHYLPSGAADSFQADVDYQSGADLDSGTWRPYALKVNDPLRTAGDRIYLLGHGYAPTFTVTFPDGQKRTSTIQWRPVNQQTQLAQGATKLDQPGITDPVLRRQRQLAITGLFAPTAVFQGTLLDSGFPDLLNPAVAIDVLRGDLGLDAGRGQSIFEVDQSLVDSGKLKRVARANLKPGQEISLDDGTKVRFDGVELWVNLQVSHDPTEGWVLIFAIALVAGLGTSLVIRRRRLWVRAAPADDGGTVVEVGGLARTDRAGYGEQFDRLAAELLRGGRPDAEH
jgi:cytochrome c biogenesis protein